MIKKILFFISMAVISIVISFVTMFNESSQGMQAFINETIETKEYENFLAYNDYYISTPLTSLDTEDYDVRVHNAFDVNRQNITFVVVDKTKSQGTSSQVTITCGTEEFTYQDLFFEYENGSIMVLTIYESGDGEYELNDACHSGVTNRLVITANDGDTIIDVTDSLEFINDDDITNSGVTGYTEEDLMDIQYPRGFFVPLLLPMAVLLAVTLGAVYLYRRYLKK